MAGCSVGWEFLVILENIRMCLYGNYKRKIVEGESMNASGVYSFECGYSGFDRSCITDKYEGVGV